jgi:alpha-galactosidase
VEPEYDAAQGYELAGFAWFQGWNDLVDKGTYPNRDNPGGYDAYSTTMAQFIRDVRKDLNAPKMPFAIGVLGVGGPSVPSDKPDHKLNLRSAMAAPTLLPEFKGNVAAVMTEKYWDLELDAACAKRDKIKQQAKKPTAKGKKAAAVEDKAALDKLLAEGLSDRERLVIEKGVSNQGYHYLGSAKILGSIGKGLAESMIQLKK